MDLWRRHLDLDKILIYNAKLSFTDNDENQYKKVCHFDLKPRKLQSAH